MYTCLVFKNLFRIFILWSREIVCSIHKSSVLISSYEFDQINYLISGFMRFGDVTNISLYSHIFFLKKTLLWALLVFIAWVYYNLDVMIEVANFYCQNYQSRTKSTISLNLIWFLLKKKNTEDIILWVFLIKIHYPLHWLVSVRSFSKQEKPKYEWINITKTSCNSLNTLWLSQMQYIYNSIWNYIYYLSPYVLNQNLILNLYPDNFS